MPVLRAMIAINSLFSRTLPNDRYLFPCNFFYDFRRTCDIIEIVFSCAVWRFRCLVGVTCATSAVPATPQPLLSVYVYADAVDDVYRIHNYLTNNEIWVRLVRVCVWACVVQTKHTGQHEF